ncbi:MAG TPA: exo-alpha-sialidase [Firmicutes bacterium]|nr:exo-alpha-sialidase [Bacillota bacterium]
MPRYFLDHSATVVLLLALTTAALPGLAASPEGMVAWEDGMSTIVQAPPGRGAWYPRLLILPDGRWLAAYDTNIGAAHGHTLIQVAESNDQGHSWRPLAVASFGHEVADAANPSLALGPDGSVFLAYRLVRPGHYEIKLSVSRDGGRSFRPLSTVATGTRGLWEPAIGWVKDELWVFYSSEERAPLYPQAICLRRSRDGGVNWEPEELVTRNPRSRDGMAAWAVVGESVYLAYEATDQGNPFAIRMIHSNDGGLTWSEPHLVYRPADSRKRASAPALVALAGPDGPSILVVAFQTDEDNRLASGDQFTDVKYVYSLDGGLSWSSAFPVLATVWPDQWAGLVLSDPAHGEIALTVTAGNRLVVRRGRIPPPPDSNS